MPATHHIDTQSRLIITTWNGEATDSEFIDALKKYHAFIRSNPEYGSFNEIVNLIKASPMNLTISGLLDIGRIATDAETKGQNRKMALIIGTDFALMLANMYIFYRNLGDNSRKQISVFKYEQEAYQWVKNDP